MWDDLFKRWIDLLFWWLPRNEEEPPEKEEEGAGVTAGRGLASTDVVEIRGARRRAERPSTSLARCAAA
jgi:hypothetical protein